MKKISRIFLPVLLCALLPLAFDSRLKTVEYAIPSEKIVGHVTLALITDLHNCLYGENQGKLVQAIAAASPDAIFLGGDIFDDAYLTDNSHTLIDKLAENHTVYYVSGNHEWWSGKIYDFFAYLEKAGVIVLRGNGDTIEVGGNEIIIGGIDDPEVNAHDASHPNFEEQLAAAAERIDEKRFNILLSHRPELARQYFSHRFDLVLSGHAHGGQFRIPFLLNGLYAPNQGFFPKLVGGRYSFGAGDLIVSRGLSKENTIVPRIFNRPELVLISLAHSGD